MTPEGGGEDLRELLRAHGKEAILAEAETAGLKVAGGRMRCPFSGCRDQSAREKKGNVGVFAGEHGVYRLKCHRCEGGGTLIDLLMATRGWAVAEAIAHVRGGQTAPLRTQLRIVPPAAPSPDKLSAGEVKRLWEALAADDAHGQGYLEGRGLEPSGFVRYATETHPSSAVRSQAKHQRRVAMLLADVVGNPRSIQFRLAREPLAKEPKVMSLKGAAIAGAFFGQPELVEASPVICVTEGMADTLAVAQWSELRLPVVGAPGKSSLPKLAEELVRCGIALDGKVFVLFPQNDRPKNESRRDFIRLSQLLAVAGARTLLVACPDEWKDVAEWRRARPETTWPPRELARVLGDDIEHETEETQLMLPTGSAVAIPRLFSAERYGQDLTTLLALLDDSVHREAIMGQGELQLSEMTERPLYSGRELVDSDVAAIRYGLEQQGRSLEGKALKFASEEVHMAMKLIASRKRVHPVREWLKGLKWDGKERIDTELPVVLGQQLGGLEAHLVRRWFISAVARAMTPGCKVDTVLVLVGGQGAGKSTFFEALGGAWFSDEKVNVEDKDGKLVMRQAWIVEWAELNAMRRARDQESIKAFLSQRIDRFRPPYGRDIIEAPRHCVIVGTTNDQEFLSDPTGSRRFWPMRVGDIDVSWVRVHREQLFAEALVAFSRGEQWWLEPEYDKQLAERNRDHETHDAWEQLVSDWLEGEPQVAWVNTDMVLMKAIDKKKEQWNHYDKMRVGAILKRLGWVESRRRVQDTVLRGYSDPRKELL